MPPPFTTFEGTGFPPEILREVMNLSFSRVNFCISKKNGGRSSFKLLNHMK